MSTSENKSMGDKTKEMYRDNMPEALGGRPPTVAEKGKEKLESAKQTIEDEGRSAKHEMGGDKSLTQKGKEAYKDNMPEALGGRPPTVAEKGKEKLDSAKQRVEDEARSAKHEMGGDKSLAEKGKETYRENMPEALGGRPPTVAAQGKEKLESAKQRVEDEARSAQHEMGGDKSLTDKSKEMYRENMPEALGGRPPTVAEKGKDKLDSAKQTVKDEARSVKHEMGGDKSLTEKGKEMYRENMPEALGGRPPTMAEKMDSATYEGKETLESGKQRMEDEARTAKEGGKTLLDKGKELYRDTMPEALGGRPPTLAEHGKKSVDEALGNKSLLQKGKEIVRDTMPQFLGGRPPTASEELKDTVDNTRAKDSLSGQMEDLSIDNRSQDDSLKGKSLAQQAKAIYKENMPEALGGRPATLAEKGQQRIQDEARSAKEVGQEVLEKGKAKVDSATTS